MKKYILLLFLIVNMTQGQVAFKYKSDYKFIKDSKVESEKFEYSYDSKTSRLVISDLDFNKKISDEKVILYASQYTMTKDLYLIMFCTDVRNFDMDIEKFPSTYSFFFYKKNGELIKIQIGYGSYYNQKLESLGYEIFLTEFGKSYLKL